MVFGPHPRSYEQRLPKRMKPPRAPGRPDIQVRRRRHQVRRGPGHGRHQDARARGLPRRAPGAGPGARGRGRQGRAAGAVGAQPARRQRHPRRLAQRGGHPERRHAGHHPAVASARWRRCTHDAPGIRRSSCARSSARSRWTRRSVDKYTFAVHDDANKLQIAAAVAGALQGHGAGRQRVRPRSAKEKSRNRKRGRVKGYTSPWKKAVVTVKSTDKIEFFEGV